MITINEIAERANVSRTTVSRVLNDSGYVSEPVRKRILKIIEETGYVPSEHAKALRTKRSKVIGVILPKISTETSGRLVDGIDEELSRKGYQILLANTKLEKEKEIQFIKLLNSRQVDGIILAATHVGEELVSEIGHLAIPLVSVGQDLPGVSVVLYDDYHAAKELTTLFIDKGHRRIGFIGVSEDDPAVGYWRKKGYMDAMEERGLPVEDHWVQTSRFDLRSGYASVKTMMETEGASRPTAIFAVTDRLAIGALQYLKKRGMGVPDTVALAGIGASEMSKHITPPLTTVDYMHENAGREAAKMILEHLSGNRSVPGKVILSYRLLSRDSL